MHAHKRAFERTQTIFNQRHVVGDFSEEQRSHQALARPRSQKARERTADLRVTVVTGASSCVAIPDRRAPIACTKAIARRSIRFF